MRRKWVIVLVSLLAALLLLAVAGYVFRNRLMAVIFAPTESNVPAVETNGAAVEVVASRLDTPWSIAFLPSGDMLVTERSGQMKRIGQEGKTYPVQGVTETSEGGLLGIALHPKFAENNLLYVYMTSDATDLSNQVDQYNLKNDTLELRKTVLSDIPAASNHNGGGIAFGPDGKLYITTGDAGNGDSSQDKTSLAGKILRVNDDGSVPSDNPYGNFVWSYGHRNPQGIAWGDKGRMWSVEHGPSGERKGVGKDELNLIDKGVNYGWPLIAGDEKGDEMRAPVANSGENDTWAPSGVGYVNGALYFAGLRGQSLYKAAINDDGTVELTRHLSREYGRLRAVTAHDGKLYVSTSNQDGRGVPAEDDDKILRIDPGQL